MVPAPYRFIDAHAVDVDAPPDKTWAALVGTFAGFCASPRWRAAAGLIGCTERQASGPSGEAGSTMAGFAVARAVEPSTWTLKGTHRFSTYELEFRIIALDEGRSRLEAQSRAAFPGPLGAAYRLLVVTSRGHRRAVGHLLDSIRRAAEATG
jgi:hypothetical protein